MGKLSGISKGLDGVKKQHHKQQLADAFGVDLDLLEEEPEASESEIQGEHLQAITAAVTTLGESLQKGSKEQLEKLDESTTAQVIEIQSGLRKLVKAMESLSKGQANSLTLAVKAQSESLQAAIDALIGAISAIPQGEIENKVVVEQTEQKPVQFDIHRDDNGQLQKVIARPYIEEAPVEKLVATFD